MADPAAATPASGRLIADYAPYALTVGAVVLGWQILLQPIAHRAPPELAAQIAPQSIVVLRRLAQAELDAGQIENAALLAREGLSQSPFDVRSLSVIGLTEARSGRIDQADEILTLAGNWSLRDDPTHGWLVENRLRRGDYGSAFAHADTLARRREEVRPQVFNLFTQAAILDTARALPQVSRLLAIKPPWRQDYLDSLYTSVDGLRVAVGLAESLERGNGALSNDELRQLYMQLLDKGQIELVRALRARLNRPPAANVANGGFDRPDTPEPFQWRLGQESGLQAEVTTEQAGGKNPALRIVYDGYSSVRIAEQLMLLKPGRYRLSARVRAESGSPASYMGWSVTCAPGDARVLADPIGPATLGSWTPVTADFTVSPACTGQWLRIEPRPDDKTSESVAWVDDVRVTAIP